MALPSLTEFLDRNHVEYAVIPHLPAYTAQGIAGLTHISGKELAKTVIAHVGETMVMVVLPANNRLDLNLLKEAAGAETAALASEFEFYNRFPECETGAMPPFGNLFAMPVYADESLTKDEEIVFNAGTHRELIRMRWNDYTRLVKPRIAHLAVRHVVEAA